MLHSEPASDPCEPVPAVTCIDSPSSDPNQGSNRPINVLLLVSSLERGGAERQVVLLANHLDPQRFRVTICSLSPAVPLAADLADRDRVLEIIRKRWRYDIGVVVRVARLMRRSGTQIVHAFLFDAEMVARLAAKLADVPVVIASERNSNYIRPTIHSLCLRLTGSLSTAMIANSLAGKRFAARTLDVPSDQIYVVHNGVDIDRFRPLEGSTLRGRLDIGPDQPLVGMVASFKPQKNHLMFLRMAEMVLRRCPETRFVCIGEKLSVEASETGVTGSGARFYLQSVEIHRMIASQLDRLGLTDRVLMPGKWDDMVDFYNACDVTVLTSRHEGTPNVLLESMACGVPVVATNVSDNERIVPEECGGVLVQLDDADAMAGAVCDLLEDRRFRDASGAAARTWVEQEFSIQALIDKTSDVYERVGHRVGLT